MTIQIAKAGNGLLNVNADANASARRTTAFMINKYAMEQAPPPSLVHPNLHQAENISLKAVMRREPIKNPTLVDPRKSYLDQSLNPSPYSPSSEEYGQDSS